jgi:hypothetical protein
MVLALLSTIVQMLTPGAGSDGPGVSRGPPRKLPQQLRGEARADEGTKALQNLREGERERADVAYPSPDR